MSRSAASAASTHVAVASAVLRFRPAARLMQAPVRKWVRGSKNYKIARVGSAECRMPNAECRVRSDEWRVPSDGSRAGTKAVPIVDFRLPIADWRAAMTGG
jgi:uncharacterized membrane protein